MTAACKLYLTYRSEYLVLGDLCVGVRDRTTGQWIPLHAATCAHVVGPLLDDGAPRSALPPRVGERLSLYAAARQVQTGPILAIERATPEVVCEADRRWQQLFGARDPRHSGISLQVPTR